METRTDAAGDAVPNARGASSHFPTRTCKLRPQTDGSENEENDGHDDDDDDADDDNDESNFLFRILGCKLCGR